MQIPMDRRDGCVNYYAEFKKCIMTNHQRRMPFTFKRSDQEYCGYYFDHWNTCRETK